MKEPRQLEPAHEALQALAEATSPTEPELERLLARRPTRVDAELHTRLQAMADATEASWIEELRARLQYSPLAGRDPRAPGWARATEPSGAEVGRVTTSPPPHGLVWHTEPLDFEIAAVTHGRLPASWAAHTEPTDDELRRLLTRRTELVGGRRRPLLPALLGAGSLAALAAAALIAVALWPTSTGYGTPDLAEGATALVAPSDVVDLGPSIDLTAHAVAGLASPRVHVAQADASGTIVDVLDGGTRFEVDPAGSYRQLTVRAGDVEVRVKGTVFTVDRLADSVAVAVERGRVQVTTPSGSFELGTGEQWTSGADAAASVDPDAVDAPAPDAPTVDVIDEDDATADREVDPDPPGARVAVAPSPAPAPPPPTPAVTQTDGISDAAAAAPAEEAGTDAAELWGAGAGQADDETAPDASSAEAPRPAVVVPETTAAVDLSDIHELRQRDQAGESTDRLLRDIDELLSRGPDDRLRPLVLQLRADVLGRAGDPWALELALGQLIADTPNLSRRAVLHVERARVREQRGDLRGALTDYRAASDAPGKTGIQALVGIATAAHALNRPGEAREALLLALQRAPDPATEEALQAMLESQSGR